MPVVAHQAIGEKVHRITLQSFAQHPLEGGEVLIPVKQTHAPVPAVQHMINQPGFNGSRCPWHDPQPITSRSPCQ